ncbi:multi-sensor signal transduction multi-kinase [Cylindrospermum sp. NIES-4074]|nr:multi-sensor signal transduction multi-kinase [Cylindrospermum sp. NIES-4074]
MLETKKTNISVENQNIENILKYVFEATAGTTGEDFFTALVRSLSLALNVPYAVATELSDGKLYSLAFWNNGKLESINCYDPAPTPCQVALDLGSYFCEQNIQHIFPKSKALVSLNAESYYGVALKDAEGKSIGVLYVVGCKPTFDPTVLEGIIQLFAIRASAELQQKRSRESIQYLSDENARLYSLEREKSRQLEETIKHLQQTQIQLVQHEKMSALGNLVAGIAHEINNPIGFLSGNLEPCQDYFDDLFALINLYQQKFPNPGAEIQEKIKAIDLEYVSQDLPKLLNSMMLGVERIRSISTSLRIFSRGDNENKVLFNVHEGLDSTILILRHRLKAKKGYPDIEVITDYGDIPLIECFPGQLNQVFMNLLANAIDALEDLNQGRGFEDITTNPHWIKICTTLSDDQHIRIQIADNGVGMTEEIKQPIFDYLFTTKPVGRGTGLGLAIARQIVLEKHGGRIEVNSVPGQGTEFDIILPIRS